MPTKNFNERCYQLLRKVPSGSLTTYQALARQLGTEASRAVGNAMNRNPYIPQVPCHRVVRSDGSVGGYALGQSKKISLLKSEGICIQGAKVVDLNNYLHRFKSQKRKNLGRNKLLRSKVL